MHLAQYGLLAALLTVSCTSHEFPRELVQFVPYPKNPVFTPGPSQQWDEGLRERGWVRVEDGTWHLWYTGVDSQRRSRLGYATSQDGLTWQRHPGNPLVPDLWAEDVMVIKEGAVYYLFAEGQADEVQLFRSEDKVRLTHRGRVDVRDTHGRPLSPGPYGTPTVWQENGVFYLFYERLDDGIWLATSRDLQVFQNVQDTPVLSLGPDLVDDQRVALGQILKYQGRYYAYYNGQGRLLAWTTNIAVSDDLIHWKKYAHNPVLPASSNKTSGVLVDDGERLRLYTMTGQVDLFLSVGPDAQ